MVIITPPRPKQDWITNPTRVRADGPTISVTEIIPCIKLARRSSTLMYYTDNKQNHKSCSTPTTADKSTEDESVRLRGSCIDHHPRKCQPSDDA